MNKWLLGWYYPLVAVGVKFLTVCLFKFALVTKQQLMMTLIIIPSNLCFPFIQFLWMKAIGKEKKKKKQKSWGTYSVHFVVWIKIKCIFYILTTEMEWAVRLCQNQYQNTLTLSCK